MFVSYFPWDYPESPYQQKSRRSIPKHSKVQYLTCVACYEIVKDDLAENELSTIPDSESKDDVSIINKIPPLICSLPEKKNLFASEEDEEECLKSHATCGDCVLGWIKAELDSNNLYPRCPEYRCNRVLTDTELEIILGDQLWDRLTSMRRAREIDSNPLARWCPKPRCGAVVMRLDEKTKKMECKECDNNGYLFCADCASPWSSGHVYRCKGEDSSIQSWALKQRSLSSRMFISEKKSQRCPSCKTRIEKDGGCNHIICWSCQAEWCWLCARPFTSDHFSNPITGCPGMQYSTINVWGKSKSGRIMRKVVGGSLALGVGVAAIGVVVGVGAAAVPVMAARAGVGHAKTAVRKHREKKEKQRRRKSNIEISVRKHQDMERFQRTKSLS
jgi:hypothetical protein